MSEMRLLRETSAPRRVSVAHQLVDGGLGSRLRVDRLDDHGAIEGRARLVVGERLARQRARHHHGIGWHMADVDLAGVAVDDLGGGADEGAHGEHRALADDDTLDHLGAGTDEAVVLDDGGVGLQRLEHAADADAAREMDVLADLGAGPDGGPCVHHGAAVHIGAQIDEGGHQHHAGADIRGPPHYCAGHRPVAGLAEGLRRHAIELGGNLVPPARGPRGAGDEAHVIEPEGQQDGLLKPLIYNPCSAVFLGHTGLALVEEVESRGDGVADFPARGWADGLALVPGGFDDRLQRCVCHECVLARARLACQMEPAACKCVVYFLLSALRPTLHALDYGRLRKGRAGFLMIARAVAWGLAGGMALVPVAAVPQELALAPVAAVVQLPTAPPTLSPDCRSKRVAGDLFRRPLRALSRAVRAKRQVRVLAIGSSSTAGVGASSPTATYIAKLETSLEGSLQGMDFDVVGKGMSGEVAQGAADRMKQEVEETKPDLVVWQLGTNDALRHVSLDKFKTCVKTTLSWLAENKIDVVLIDPQYGDALTKDEHYEKVVGALAEVAKEMRVLLVDRFEAMRELQRERGDLFYLSTDKLHPNDRGHRCMAEQVARAIVGGLIQADADQAQPIFYP